MKFYVWSHKKYVSAYVHESCAWKLNGKIGKKKLPGEK